MLKHLNDKLVDQQSLSEASISINESNWQIQPVSGALAIIPVTRILEGTTQEIKNYCIYSPNFSGMDGLLGFATKFAFLKEKDATVQTWSLGVLVLISGKVNGDVTIEAQDAKSGVLCRIGTFKGTQVESMLRSIGSKQSSMPYRLYCYYYGGMSLASSSIS